ncbi:MAG TPA: hypothetical protein VIG60_09820 [Savagea sp.]
MQKRLITLLVVGGLIAVFAIWLQSSSSSKTKDDTFSVEIIHLPKQFEGCTYVVYDVPDAPPLAIEDGAITYDFSTEDTLFTSSPPTFGWLSEEASGSYVTHILEEGEKQPDDTIPFGAVGATETAQGDVIDYATYHVRGIHDCSLPQSVIDEVVKRRE